MKPLLSPALISTLTGLSYTLDAEQLHIGGERALMSVHKLVLTGTNEQGGMRVVLKVSLDAVGARDIAAEHTVRELLLGVRFASRDLSFPAELLFGVYHGHTISVTEFISQDRVFVDYPLREQFFMILKLFESQEEFHATTYEHTKSLLGVIPVWGAEAYIQDTQAAAQAIAAIYPNCNQAHILTALMSESGALTERYSGFLDHTDLVPHNFRVKSGALFALDQVAIRFGNKYEMWARFINYMVIHNPELADLLTAYVAEKRGAEDAEMLRVMRCYKAGVLLRYYAESAQKASGDMKELTLKRFVFWEQVLLHLLQGTPIPREMVAEYIAVRDTLRSEDEKKRQREFARA